MTSQLTPQELERQLACLYCGIVWSGTLNQQRASMKSNTPSISTVDDQLNAMAPDEARAARRKFRKLWRAYAKRNGLSIERIKKGMMGSKVVWAEREALRIYRERNNTATRGGEQ